MRTKPHDWFNGHEGGPSEAAWNPSRAQLDRNNTDGHPLHTGPSPAVSTSSCYWIKMDRDDRVKLTTMRNSPSLKSNCCASHDLTSPLQLPPTKSPPLTLPKVLRRWMRDEATGVDTLAVVATTLHVGGPDHVVVFQ